MAAESGRNPPPAERNARPGSAVNTLLKIQSQFEEWEERDRIKRKRTLLMVFGTLLAAAVFLGTIVFALSGRGEREQRAPTAAAAPKAAELKPAAAAAPATPPTATRYVTAITPEPRYARYADAWRRKVETAAQTAAMPRAGLYGSLVLTTYIRPDGTVARIEISRSSGQDALDRAAVDIVRAAAPFDAFPDEIRRDTAALAIVRTFSFERGEAKPAR
jgi:TonB family protein